jgi:glycosyltransferase involved in cell wall biosynthesis
MEKKLTIIIPFLNEGEEVGKTVASVLGTATGSPDIILINDGSTDGYDYAAVAAQYGCRYVEHTARQGVSASRDEGVAMAETPYFLLLDAHMAMYGKGWDERVCTLLESEPRALVCARSVMLSPERVAGTVVTHGAHIAFSEGIRARWNKAYEIPDGNVVEVECPLGAAYAMRKDYYERLHGLQGLRGYGGDEEFLSLKIRWEGGRILLVKDWTAGHIYGGQRNASASASADTNANANAGTNDNGATAAQRFRRSAVDGCYNRIVIAELLFSGDTRRQLLAWIEKRYGESYLRAYDRVMAGYSWVEREREYLLEVFKQGQQAA